jgi:hypothetical protein
LTPLAQAGGESPGRFVFGRRLAKQSIKVVNWSDALLSGQFLEGRRSGALGSGRCDWLCPLVHESRIAGQRPLAASGHDSLMSCGAGHRVYPATDGSKMQASQMRTSWARAGATNRPRVVAQPLSHKAPSPRQCNLAQWFAPPCRFDRLRLSRLRLKALSQGAGYRVAVAASSARYRSRCASGSA